MENEKITLKQVKKHFKNAIVVQKNWDKFIKHTKHIISPHFHLIFQSLHKTYYFYQLDLHKN